MLDDPHHSEQFDHFDKSIETCETRHSCEIIDLGCILQNKRDWKYCHEINPKPASHVITGYFASSVNQHICAIVVG